MSGYDIDTFFPLQGTCFHCGRDERSHTLEEINARYSKGEDFNVLASAFNVPIPAIQLVIHQLSGAPLGAGLALPLKAKAAAA